MAVATQQDPAFDLAAAVQHIIAEGLAVAYRLSSEQKTFQPRPADLAAKSFP
jgi:hypothetical protein